MKNFKRLGFNQTETDQIVDQLNLLLANWHVHYQKLRHFHWNVTGHDFFDLHEKFEQEYNRVKVQIDEIAERIRVFGRYPDGHMSLYLANASIEEPKPGLTSDEMVREILSDYENLMTVMVEAHEKVSAAGDIATEDLLTQYIKRLEKMHWMFSAFLRDATVTA